MAERNARGDSLGDRLADGRLNAGGPAAITQFPETRRTLV